MPLDEELVDVAGLLGVEAPKCEVVDDQEVGDEETTHGAFGGQVSAALVKQAQELVGTDEEHVVTGTARSVAECAGQEGLPDADGAHEDDVLGAVDETEAEKIADTIAVEGDLGFPVEALESLLLLESGSVQAVVQRLVIASVDLVLEHELDELEVIQFLLPAIGDPAR